MGSNLTLGISKIGDLLLKNRISETENGNSIEDIKLTIPEYQRPYKWTAKNANQLLDDIEEAMNSNKEVYRVGTLILHHDKDGNYNIVDGQQRTITFALMLDCLGKEPIGFLDQSLSENSFNLHNVVNNHRALERRIDKLLIEDKDRRYLAEYITDHCELIVVITDDLSEAFQFFDSQNARGKTLYPHDLLKAYHLREMSNVDAAETEKVVWLTRPALNPFSVPERMDHPVVLTTKRNGVLKVVHPKITKSMIIGMKHSKNRIRNFPDPG